MMLPTGEIFKREFSFPCYIVIMMTAFYCTGKSHQSQTNRNKKKSKPWNDLIDRWKQVTGMYSLLKQVMLTSGSLGKRCADFQKFDNY